MIIVNVALDVPLNTIFSYSSSEELAVGQRVLVSFRNKNVIGFVLEIGVNSSIEVPKLKPILASYPEILSSDFLDLIKFAAKYYCYPLGQSLLQSVPLIFKQPKPPIDYKEADYNNKPATNHSQPPSPKTLNQEQLAAFNSVKANLNSYYPVLLYGITGSGKTEVYLEMIAEALSLGQQALVLVPEINLTPQLLARFAGRFNLKTIYVLNSQATKVARYKGYLAATSGYADIIIGTRLAVFTPFKNLGIIIVDEEHDSSFKQNDGFRYHARDLAIWRASYYQIPIILGSATPSLETLNNHYNGKYHLSQLPNRAITNAKLPLIKLVDLSKNITPGAISDRAILEVEERIKARELSLVFINRRGFAPLIRCYDCGFVSKCTNCSSNMVYHATTKKIQCHHCGVSKAVPVSCPECASQYLMPLGYGTQKIEDLLSQKLPHAKIVRIDQDSVTSKNYWSELRQKIDNNEIDVLVGTQMLAKGHDFPKLTLAVCLNTDSSIYSYDFRASENTFALLTQVAGRAGRFKPGEVLIETNYPKNSLFAYLKKHDFIGYAKFTLNERRDFGMPPYTYYAILRIAHAKLATAIMYLETIIKKVAGIIPKEVQIYPAVPAVMQRLKNQERAQVLISATNRQALHYILEEINKAIIALKIASKANISIDVDPIEV